MKQTGCRSTVFFVPLRLLLVANKISYGAVLFWGFCTILCPQRELQYIDFETLKSLAVLAETVLANLCVSTAVAVFLLH